MIYFPDVGFFHLESLTNKTHTLAFYTQFTNSIGGLLLSSCLKAILVMKFSANHLHYDAS